MSTERKTPGHVSAPKCLLCGKGERGVPDLEKHLREWHKVSTTDEALIASLLDLLSSSSLERRKSQFGTSATTLKGPFREISNRLADKGGTLPIRMCSPQNAKSFTLGNILVLDKENQEKEGMPLPIPPLPKTRSGSGSPGGQAKPNRRRSLTEFVQKSPGRVRLKGSPIHQTKFSSEKRSSWIDYIQSPGTIKALESATYELQKETGSVLDSEFPKTNTIPNTRIDLEINLTFDSPSKYFDANDMQKMGANEECTSTESSSETKDPEVEEDRAKALIATRR